MKIAHVITRLVAGGAQRNTLLCADAQTAEGHQVTVLSGLETGSEGSLLEQAGAAPYRLVEIPCLVREISPARDVRALLSLVSWLRSERPDVLHTHTSKAGILGRLASVFAPVPVVVHTPHGHVFHSYFSRLKAQLFKALEKIFDPLTDATVMLSQGELRDHLAEGVGSAERMYIIPSGVPLEGFRSHRNITENSAPNIGYVGRLADIKGPLDLIDAMALVSQSVEARLMIVGDGPLRSEVEASVDRHSLRDKVRILGWQDCPAAFFREMDVLVVPSHNEGMGRVVVEAMACGLPVVATDVGGLPDLVLPGLTGELVPPHDPGSLARAVLAVLRLEDRGRAMGLRGQRHALQFSDQVMFERLALLYSKLARSKGLKEAGPNGN